MEAVLGAVYVDGGIDAATLFVQRWILSHLGEVMHHPSPARDAKSRLLHFAQTRGLGQPTYAILEESGPPHDKTFEVGCVVDGRVVGRANGKSRQLSARRPRPLRDSRSAAPKPIPSRQEPPA